ncbi:MAG: glycoside hydrolase family 2 [Clostridia bacterium]|nr:glycoside hydrolase family 2 [Clostridia bacterium]
MSKRIRTVELTTPFEENTQTSWQSEYPRPQMKRDSWYSLCGEWNLSVGEREIGAIRLPFVPESRLSGIKRTLEKGERFVYRRGFTLPEDFNKGRVLLHFGAVDQTAEVWLNGVPVGGHTGGYLPFSFDVTDKIKIGENLLCVEVGDPLDRDLAYGKQRKKRGGMWYTPISGIWQTVWMESVLENYISRIKLTTDLCGVKIETEGGKSEKTLKITTPDGEIGYSYSGDSTYVKIDSPRLWSPEDPYLYGFTLSDGEDEIESYFALRTVSIQRRGDRSYICLNGKPYFFHGLLDQGYYSDGICLPASPDGYKWDILKMKELGFNTLRKHIKIEPDLFYHYCDKYGMIVFQDMVNSGKYSWFIDTALPNIGLKRWFKRRASKSRKNAFESDSKQTVELLYNHPSVCYYTIFNEGWGQYDADGVYDTLKPLDPTRIWDSTSGWFAKKKSDVVSEHIYFRRVKLKACRERPTVLSEFGGYSCRIDGHSFNLDKNYGYTSYKTPKEFEAALLRLYREEIIPAIKCGLSGAILTQVSDVEDETNGLVTYDRRVVKVDAEAMSELALEMKKTFSENEQ